MILYTSVCLGTRSLNFIKMNPHPCPQSELTIPHTRVHAYALSLLFRNWCSEQKRDSVSYWASSNNYFHWKHFTKRDFHMYFDLANKKNQYWQDNSVRKQERKEEEQEKAKNVSLWVFLQVSDLKIKQRRKPWCNLPADPVKYFIETMKLVG